MPPKTQASDQPWDLSVRAYNDNTAQARLSARNAQLFAYGSLLVAALSLGLVFALIGQPRLVPYAIAVNEHGQVNAIGISQPLSADQNALLEVTQFELRQFVEAWRFVAPYTASDFQQTMIDHYVKPLMNGGQAQEVIAGFYSAANPYERNHSTIVQVTADQPIPQTTTTYALHWYETATQLDGSEPQTTEWRGYATVSYHTPTAQEAVLNPAGLTLVTLSIQQVSSANPTPPPPSPGALP